MIQLELPHVNVLSKIDLIESYGKLSKYSVNMDAGGQGINEWVV